MNATWRITRCLAIVCGCAGIVLGASYFLTEPPRRTNAVAMERASVRRLLALADNAVVTEVRRYLGTAADGETIVAYLLPRALRLFDTAGTVRTSVPTPATLADAPTSARDHWVGAQLPAARYVGRFFVATTPTGERVGYVTESAQYGFKGAIRFFAAVDADGRLRGVEVIQHEEDPGLGAEIVRPAFIDQFRGRTAAALSGLRVSKDPRPATPPTEIDRTPIYAVTGATISSTALTEGVKRAVAHLQQRLDILEKGAMP